MEGREKKLFLDYAQRFVIAGEPVQHDSVIDFMFNHPLARDEFEYWLNIGEKVDWTRAKSNTGPSHVNLNEMGAKDPTESIKMRNKGSSHFAKAGVVSNKTEILTKALFCYNVAIQHSCVTLDSDSSELEHTSILFANRSAVFFELSRYHNALDDIELAIKFGYPSHLSWKILIRKANILLIKKDFGEVLELVERVQNTLTPECQASNTAAVSRKLDVLADAAREGLKDPHLGIISDAELGNNNKFRKLYNTTKYDENPEFEYASKAISIKFTAKAQRFVEAVSDIEFGDILFDEVPYASVLIPEYEATHCHYCHANTLLSIFPCRSCSQVVYCSEKCAVQSWSEYHQFECMNLHLLQSVGLGHLATRIALIARPEQILETLQVESKLRDYSDTIPLYRKGGSKYQRVFSLIHHSKECNPLDFFKYAEVSAFTTYWLLKRTSFFRDVPESDIYKIGGVILRHFCQLICNAQRVYSFPVSPDGEYLTHEKRLSVGSAIFTSTSMMNHSCDPKISTNYKVSSGEGRRFIVKAVEAVRAGTEISNSYGLTFRRHDFAFRQQSLLQQYFFRCRCERCIQEEKDGFSFVEQFSSLQCHQCRGPVYVTPNADEATCKSCNKVLGFKSAESVLLLTSRFQDSALEAIVQEDFNVALNRLESCHSLRRKLLQPDHSLMAETYDSFARLYNAMGKNDLALPYLKKSLAHVKLRYGDHSNEYALELQKYLQLVPTTGLTAEEFANEQERNSLINSCNRLLEAYSPAT